MLTATEFAQQKGINYRTALNWLRAGRAPCAVEKETPMGKYWEIPSTALNVEKPKPGPVPKRVADAAETKPVAKKVEKKAGKPAVETKATKKQAAKKVSK